VRRVLSETGLPPQRLELEITEGIILQNTEAVLETLTRLDQLGVSIAMEDFGTGYFQPFLPHPLPGQEDQDRSLLLDTLGTSPSRASSASASRST